MALTIFKKVRLSVAPMCLLEVGGQLKDFFQTATLAGVLIFGCALQSRADSPEIAYLGLADGVWQCWVISRDGTGARQITDTEQDKIRVSWYPDGERLLVNSADGFAYEVSINTLDEKRISIPLNGFQDAVISPDGRMIAFSLSTSGSRDDNNIWVFGIQEGDLRKLTNMPWLQHDPVWSHDGRQIYFLSGDGGQTHDIWRIGLDSNSDSGRQLTAHQAYHFDVAVSADGVLAYSNNRTGSYNIWIRHGADAETQITRHSALDARPSWSPDGKQLIFESSREDGLDLWLMEISSQTVTRITNTEGGARAPVWRTRGLSE